MISSVTHAGLRGAELEQRVRAQAYALGFDLAGIAKLGPADTAAYFDAWLEKRYDGEMGYLARGAEKRRDSRLPVDGARSAIVVGMDYGGRSAPGPIARYARGDDYHDVMIEKLRALHGWIDGELGSPVPGKAYVDTGPILERDLARRAGLGWFGKNTMLINPGRGSFFFLGTLLLAIDLEPDEPFQADRCGTCTRCLDACPTGAFTEPRVLDATRCISYLTIELKGAIDEALREPIGGNIYGCDICQDVCPWNQRFATEHAPAELAPRELGTQDARALARSLLAMSEDDFRSRFRRSPMKRARRRGLARNAAVVLGNVGTGDDIPALDAATRHDDPLVREHAAWARARLNPTSEHD